MEQGFRIGFRPAFVSGQVSYDVENRLVSVPTGSLPEQYAYAPNNKRVWKRMSDGTEELYFYGISGQKLGTYKPFVYQYGLSITTIDTNLYFGSRTIVSRGVTVTPDRVGSNRAGGSRYFPYGEEQQVTAQDRDKFATYYRDSTTTLDYAQNRYYASTLGRFTSPDPYKSGSGSGTPANPRSWNRYTYVEGDPVNGNDPSGEATCGVSGFYQDDSGQWWEKLNCYSDGRTQSGNVAYQIPGQPTTLNYHDQTFLQRAQDDIGTGMDQYEWSQTLAAAEAVRRKILNWQLSTDCEAALVQIKPDGIHPLGRTDVISAAFES